MSTISQETARAIALAWREVETAEKLLADVCAAMDSFNPADIRDVFGRRADGLQLGVPSGRDGHRLFNVPYGLAIPIIETHIVTQRAEIALLSEKAAAELKASA